MVSFNNYSLRNMPSVHHGRMNVWNRHEAYAQGMRNEFYRNVPPELYSAPMIGFPGCGFPPIFCCTPPIYPMVGCCGGIGAAYTGLIAGNIFGQAVSSIVGAVRSIFSRA